MVRLTKRCTTCGESAGQHEDVCRECGFQSFEPLTPGPTAGEVDSSYIQWRCTDCGHAVPRNSPPCDRCGNMTLEKEHLSEDDVDVAAEVAAEFEDRGTLTRSDWRILAAVLAVAVLFAIVTLL